MNKETTSSNIEFLVTHSLSWGDVASALCFTGQDIKEMARLIWNLPKDNAKAMLRDLKKLKKICISDPIRNDEEDMYDAEELHRLIEDGLSNGQGFTVYDMMRLELLEALLSDLIENMVFEYKLLPTIKKFISVVKGIARDIGEIK